MNNKMNPVVKALWIEGLRSGLYKQAKNALNVCDKFCCLGVLTELYRKSSANTSNIQWTESKFTKLHGDGRKAFGATDSCTVLPQKVMEWAGLEFFGGAVVDLTLGKDFTTFKGLSTLNDEGYTFPQIADLIEAQL